MATWSLNEATPRAEGTAWLENGAGAPQTTSGPRFAAPRLPCRLCPGREGAAPGRDQAPDPLLSSRAVAIGSGLSTQSRARDGGPAGPHPPALAPGVHPQPSGTGRRGARGAGLVPAVGWTARAAGRAAGLRHSSFPRQLRPFPASKGQKLIFQVGPAQSSGELPLRRRCAGLILLAPRRGELPRPLLSPLLGVFWAGALFLPIGSRVVTPAAQAGLETRSLPPSGGCRAAGSGSPLPTAEPGRDFSASQRMLGAIDFPTKPHPAFPAPAPSTTGRPPVPPGVPAPSNPLSPPRCPWKASEKPLRPGLPQIHLLPTGTARAAGPFETPPAPG